MEALVLSFDHAAGEGLRSYTSQLWTLVKGYGSPPVRVSTATSKYVGREPVLELGNDATVIGR